MRRTGRAAARAQPPPASSPPSSPPSATTGSSLSLSVSSVAMEERATATATTAAVAEPPSAAPPAVPAPANGPVLDDATEDGGFSAVVERTQYRHILNALLNDAAEHNNRWENRGTYYISRVAATMPDPVFVWIHRWPRIPAHFCISSHFKGSGGLIRASWRLRRLLSEGYVFAVSSSDDEDRDRGTGGASASASSRPTESRVRSAAEPATDSYVRRMRLAPFAMWDLRNTVVVPRPCTDSASDAMDTSSDDDDERAAHGPMPELVCDASGDDECPLCEPAQCTGRRTRAAPTFPESPSNTHLCRRLRAITAVLRSESDAYVRRIWRTVMSRAWAAHKPRRRRPPRLGTAYRAAIAEDAFDMLRDVLHHSLLLRDYTGALRCGTAWPP